MATVNSYLNFDGNCEEAFLFYRSVFGGDFAYVGRFNEMPDDSISEDDKNKIMHITLPISTETMLFGSDILPSMGGSFIKGNNISISINATSKEEADHLFNGLSEGGTITMPIANTFWNAYFGMFIDKFGINWMVNYDLPTE